MTLNPSVTTRTYNLGPVKPWVESAAILVGNKFGVKTIYGWRAHDTFPDHPSGHALDFMITSKSQGQAIADFLQANAAQLGVKYIIWNRQVWEASGKPVAGWHPYTSTNNPHTDHVHVTFNDTPGTGGTTTDAVLTSSSGSSVNPATCAWSFKFPVAGEVCLLSKTQLRQLLGVSLILAGVGIGVVGIAFMTVLSFRHEALNTIVGAVRG